ncbi:MAG: hypothetical protein ACK4UN_03135 [Limisphaerales bacterium]
MTYTEAQKEFSIRLYRWAEMALKAEIQQSFPNFQYCKEWPTRTCLFLKSLDPHSQAALAKAMLQTRHKEAAEELNESISEEGVKLIRQEEGFRCRTSPGTWEGAYRPIDTKNAPLMATRRQLKSAMKKHFLAAFGSQCLPPDPLDGKTDLVFAIKCRGWIVKTFFEFGRWDPEIVHSHNVWTGKWITREEPAVLLANSIGFRLNYGNELGIGAGWENITVENIDPVCNEIIEHCRRMFEVYPVLLEGLDLELLTA